MISLTMIVVGNKFKVYREIVNDRRKLVGTFKSEDEAIRFMNNYR